MPIKINLLAEAQAAEEMRRKDPVKRACWIGGFLVALVLIYVGDLQFTISLDSGKMKGEQDDWTKIEPEYKKVMADRKKTDEINGHLAALDRFATNRFYWGTLLNVLQQNLVDNIQLTRLRSSQFFDYTPLKTNGTSRIPAASVEHMTLELEARDWDPAHFTYNKFKDAVSSTSYFASLLKRTDGFEFKGTIGSKTPDPADPAREFVIFSLETHVPDVKRTAP